MSQLGNQISAGLNYAPSTPGNPYAGILAGPMGLAQQYGQSYNNALSANQQNYNNIIGGYQTVMGNVGNTLGAGGGWGVAAPAAQAIGDVYAQQSGGALQNSINRGIGNTSAATAAQRGASLDASKAYAGLGAQLSSTYAGYEANIGQNELNFMNGVQIPYPNGAEYSSLYQQYGQQQQAQASMAQQMALSQQQLRLAAGSRGGGGGGGGVSIPATPRGGTYGSGGGSFPSGGGVNPGMFGGIASDNIGKNGPMTGGVYTPQSTNGFTGGFTGSSGPPGSGFNPWGGSAGAATGGGMSVGGSGGTQNTPQPGDWGWMQADAANAGGGAYLGGGGDF